MNKRLRKWIGWSAAVVGTLALAAAAVPYAVDAESYKPAIVEAVKAATGRELVVKGPIEFSMYPLPGVAARQVRFANALGTTGAQMLDVQNVIIRPALGALLQGRLEVGTLFLYRPAIVLEADSDGIPNWQFGPGAGAAQPAGAPSSGFHLAIGRLAIVDGTIRYTDPWTGAKTFAEKVNVQASVRSLDGPFSIAGTATVNGVPLSLDLKVGEPTVDGHAVELSLKMPSGKLDVTGRLSEFGPHGRLAGRLSVDTAHLPGLIASLASVGGQGTVAVDAAMAGRFVFDGGFEASPGRLAATDFRMSFGDETATGSLVLSLKPSIVLNGRLSLPKLDLDKWLAAVVRTDPPQPPATAAIAGPKSAKPPKTPAAGPPTLLPPELGASLAIDVGDLAYRRGIVRDLSMGIEVRAGTIALSRARATLPGDMALRAASAVSGSPAWPAASGEFSVRGPRLRETLAWLGVDATGIAADRLQTLEVSGTMMSAADKLQVHATSIGVDGSTAAGSLTLDLASPLSAVAQIQIDRLNLDAYLAGPRPDSGAKTAPADAPPEPSAAPSDPAGPRFGLKVKAANVVLRGKTLKGIDADVAVQGRLLKLNTLKVADLLGAKGDLSGSVTNFNTVPRVDLAFNVTMPDTDRVLDYAALPKFLNGTIGASTASGQVAGTMGGLAVRNVSVTMLGTTATAAGSVVLGSGFRFDFARFSLQAADVSQLVSVASGSPQTGLGAFSATGTFKGDAERATFKGDLTALGSEMAGTIDATIGARPNIAATLKIPGTLDIDQWLGVSAAPVPATVSRPPPDRAPSVVAPRLPSGEARTSTAKPIDLAPFRAFDASLTLFTRSIVVSSLRVNYGDASATLKNGVLKVSKLTGQFFGGAVDFTGSADASKAVLSIDLAGSLQGIHLAEMLQGAAGTNSFGNDNLTVAIDGKASIMDIELKGRGNSLEEIRNSLVGRGHLTGEFFPAVTKGSLSFASFATGVGSIFSTEMGFSSAVLQGFINQHDKISGEVTLADGVLVLNKHTVRGNNAEATITSHTKLVEATTDTTILLDIGATGPADYVMKVQGPVGSPTLTTKAGPGR